MAYKPLIITADQIQTAEVGLSTGSSNGVQSRRDMGKMAKTAATGESRSSLSNRLCLEGPFISEV
jgi:hypothetical protein